MLKRKEYDTKIILPRREEHEIPKGKLGLVFCKNCNSVYYKKSWHHNLRNYKKLKEDLKIVFSLCPACKMIKNNQFEGRLVVENIPVKIYDSLAHLIENFCRRAFQKDPLDRLIKIKKAKNSLEITTTENQLAVKLAKKIREVFKKVEMKISYSPAPGDAVYINLKFF